MDCGEFPAVAAELALGVLTGRARAEALAHAEDCAGCRETLRQLTLTGEDLLQVLPAAEPPPGFETRVLDRLGLPPASAAGRRRPGLRYRKTLAAAVAAAAVIAAGLGGWGLRGLEAGPAPSPPLTSAALTAGGHAGAGEVYYYAGSPRWLYMWADLPGGNGVVACQVRGADGRYATVGWFRLNGGYGSWGSPVPQVSGPVTGARLLGPGGRILAVARFLPAATGLRLDHRAGDGRIGAMTTAISAGTVGSAMLLEPTVHPADLTVAQARDAFDFSRKRHMLLLVRDGMLLGTLTRDDLPSGAAGPGSPALDFASLEGRTVSPDAPLAFTHEAMCSRGIRRLAVTDDRGRLLGLLCLKRSLRGFCTDEGVAALRAERAR